MTLLRWVDREARAADSDKIRAFAMHGGFRRLLRRSGYFQVKSTMEFVVKVNAVAVPAELLREHRPLARHAGRLGSGSMSAPGLLVGIDTEGDNQWDAAARARPDVREHLRAAAASRAVSPGTASGRPTSSRIRSRWIRGRPTCCAGCSRAATARLARITTPGKRRRAPRPTSRRHPYASSLPRVQFEQQLESLTSAITAASGTRPVSYRSGRFGFSAAHVSAPRAAGYLVDSSVAPLFYESHKGGPEFVDAPLTPYFLAYDSATRPGSSDVLEVPVSAALNRRLPKLLQYAYARAPRPYTTKRVLRALAPAAGCGGSGRRTRRSTT